MKPFRSDRNFTDETGQLKVGKHWFLWLFSANKSKNFIPICYM
jgi:hypothetical protein